jgi:tetratricopeptide (TPR) repeat protein
MWALLRIWAAFVLGFCLFGEAQSSDAADQPAKDADYQFLFLHDKWGPSQTETTNEYRKLGSDITDLQRQITALPEVANGAHPEIANGMQKFSNEFDCLDLAEKGWSDVAAEACKDKLNSYPDSPSGWNNLGWAYQRGGDYKDPIAAYTKAINLSPGYDKPLINRSDVYGKIGDFAHAAADLEVLNKYHSNSYNYLMNKCGLYENFSKLSEAEAACRKSVRLFGSTDTSDSNLGWIFFSRGDYATAEKFFVSAIKRNPRNMTARTNLMETHARQLKIKEALADAADTAELTGNRDHDESELNALFPLLFLALEDPKNRARINAQTDIADALRVLIQIQNTAVSGDSAKLTDAVKALHQRHPEVFSALTRSSPKLVTLDPNALPKLQPTIDQRNAATLPPGSSSTDRVLCYLEGRQREFSGYYEHLPTNLDIPGNYDLRNEFPGIFVQTQFTDLAARQILALLMHDLRATLEPNDIKKLEKVVVASLPARDVNADVQRVPTAENLCPDNGKSPNIDTNYDDRIITVNSRVFRFVHNALNATFPFFSFIYAPLTTALPQQQEISDTFREKLDKGVSQALASHIEEFLRYDAQANLPITTHWQLLRYHANLLKGAELFVLSHEVAHILRDDDPDSTRTGTVLEQEIRADYLGFRRLGQLAGVQVSGERNPLLQSVLLASPIILMKHLEILQRAQDELSGVKPQAALTEDVIRTIASTLGPVFS